jgi:hypothetical protein
MACCSVKPGRLLLPVGEKKREKDMLCSGREVNCDRSDAWFRCVSQLVTTTSQNTASPSVHSPVAKFDAL